MLHASCQIECGTAWVCMSRLKTDDQFGAVKGTIACVQWCLEATFGSLGILSILCKS